MKTLHLLFVGLLVSGLVAKQYGWWSGSLSVPTIKESWRD